LEKFFKVLRRAVVLEYYANKPARGALGGIVKPLKAMIEEMVEYALEHNVSQKTLHRVFYERYREQYPWSQRGLLRDPIEMLLGGRRALERLGKGVGLILID
jgi:hypothetical protein